MKRPLFFFSVIIDISARSAFYGSVRRLGVDIRRKSDYTYIPKLNNGLARYLKLLVDSVTLQEREKAVSSLRSGRIRVGSRIDRRDSDTGCLGERTGGR